MRRWVLAALVLAAGCGDEPEGLPVGEAAPPQTLGADPFVAPLVTPDSAVLAPGDSLRADTLARDTLAVEPVPLQNSEEPPLPPAFEAAWRAFLAGEDLAVAPALRPSAARALAPPFEAAVRAARPETFLRDGTHRAATLRVGFDAAGAVVPQDEAVRDSTLRLQFDVIAGAYRLVGASFSE